MKNKIFVICLRHDENLLSLYQEAHYLDYEVIPLYINKLDDRIKSLDNIITINDYVMILHTNFGSDVIHYLAQNIKCKRFLNKSAFSHILIGDKQYQQEQVAIVNPSIFILSKQSIFKGPVDLKEWAWEYPQEYLKLDLIRRKLMRAFLDTRYKLCRTRLLREFSRF